MMQPILEGEVFDTAETTQAKDLHTSSTAIFSGVVFARSIRAAYATLHVAGYLDTSSAHGEGDAEDEELEYVAVRIQFQGQVTQLRSFVRRYCKMYDRLAFATGRWEQHHRSRELKGDFADLTNYFWYHRFVLDVSTVDQANKIIRLEQQRAWTPKQCHSWQREYNVLTTKEKPVVVPPRDARPRNEGDQQEEFCTCEHARGSLQKRLQGEYLAKFLVAMIMNDLDELPETHWAPSCIDFQSPAFHKAVQCLNRGSGVMDVAGGAGFVSMALGTLGIQSTVIDAREGVGILPRKDRKQWSRRLREKNNGILQGQYCQPVKYNAIRAWFGEPPAGVDPSHRHPDHDTLPVIDPSTSAECSAIVGLHPDEATDTIVDTAIKLQIPFAVVPCCVFSRLFPHRRKPMEDGATVTTRGDLLDYLVAKHPSIRRTTLPFVGANVILWSTFK